MEKPQTKMDETTALSWFVYGLRCLLGTEDLGAIQPQLVAIQAQLKKIENMLMTEPETANKEMARQLRNILDQIEREMNEEQTDLLKALLEAQIERLENAS